MMLDLIDTSANLFKVGLGAALGYYVGVTRNEVKAVRREAHLVDEHLHQHETKPPPIAHDPANPPPPLPLPGQPGEPGEGSQGGDGGDGGRGGIGVTGARGRRGAKGDQGDDRDSPFQRKALMVIVILVAAFGAYYATSASDRLDKAEAHDRRATVQRELLKAEQATFEKQVKCQNKIEVANTDAQKARASFNEQQAQIMLDLFNAFLDPDVTQQQAKRALITAQTAVRDSLKVAKDNPFPPIADVRECLDK